jgi:peptide-methionine (S)-S-oxide reductase
MSEKNNYEIAVFGGGCFWCTEAIFANLKGVVSVMPGYSGGNKPDPSYEEVSGGNTGHVECTKIEFDPKVISFNDLLNVFFHTHDPTTLNKQGADIGTQYRSVIFYTNQKQKEEALNFIDKLEKSHDYKDSIVTAIEPLDKFYLAEDYHQKYYESHKDAPYCQIVIEPKLEKLNKEFKKFVI